jgi:hypothetical protein
MLTLGSINVEVLREAAAKSKRGLCSEVGDGMKG